MDNKKSIQKILKHIDKILNYTKDMNFNTFNIDEKNIDACLMNFATIGETVNDIDENFINEHKEINWKEMKGMRNIIVHDYDGVNTRIVWDTIKDDLPKLREQLNNLIG